MCICTSETSRPRLFNWVLVILISGWVLLVSAIAHTVPGSIDMAAQAEEATMSAALEMLFDR